MSTRDEILARVRANQPAPRPLPELPLFPAKVPSLLEAFESGLTRMGGQWVALPADTTLERWIDGAYPSAKVICSATAECRGTRELSAVRDPAELSDVDVGVVRAEFGVAETGSVWLTQGSLGWSALGFLAQHLVVLLDPARIVAGLQDAYRMRERFEVGYGILMTGPSATADIEGVLIHGAQGVRTLAVIPLAAPAP
jgi:L-lactate dehydrogenase complex protein LldG